jgi:hypothetical protein
MAALAGAAAALGIVAAALGLQGRSRHRLWLSLSLGGGLADRFDPSRQPHDGPRGFGPIGVIRADDTGERDGSRDKKQRS